MDATELSFGIVNVLQVSIGISVNVFLLLFYIHMASTSHRPSSSDLILTQLALANIIILLSRGIPDTASAWGLRNFLDDVGCKILMYLYRVSRGLAICTTCLLSVFQAITISPGTSWWAEVKAKLPKCIIPLCILSWVLNMLIGIDILIYVTGPQNSSSVRITLDLTYCSKVSSSEAINLVIAVVLPLWNLFFVGLMSGYMVFVLHRHYRQVRHLHGPGRSTRVLPEVRAAKRVMALVTLYVLLYGRQSIMRSVILNMQKKSPLLVSSHLLMAFAFSVISPFLMIHSERRMRTFWKREHPFSNPDPS
uniref:vomeronasal 1 receptor ornAnaV1R3106 n=1 Tax=Ornithorhynchus anatinus TaxID=9258 RepID=UPI00023AC9FE|nr:vomeronasal 1 receptor ornAnaV1R3106 [Ornithorhynchus anatinus]